jgi:hypothetical protein
LFEAAFRLLTKGSEKAFPRCLLSFLIGMAVEKADFRSWCLLSGGRSPSLLVASSCGVSPETLNPPGVKHLPLQSASIRLINFLKILFNKLLKPSSSNYYVKDEQTKVFAYSFLRN